MKKLVRIGSILGFLALALVLSCNSSGTAGSDGGTGGPGGPQQQYTGQACGYKDQGAIVKVADNVELCMPPVVCTSETCPPSLGQCQNGKCVFADSYQGVQTLPQAWATHYCRLSTQGCHGVTQIEFPEVTAQTIATQTGNPLCDGSSSATGTCIGIAASSPMLVGNSQEAIDGATGKLVTLWGLGYTEANGLCYEVTGPGGVALVALTDRCGGYCKCNGSDYMECGPCVSAPSMVPNCPCVGTAPGLYGECCGLDCSTLNGSCDWCASNNHPHFDLDDSTFDWVCGPQKSRGSCQLTSVKTVSCFTPKSWPPGGGGAGCADGSFQCNGTPAAHQNAVPNTTCCCNYNACPQTDGTCAAAPAQCKTGSCACGSGMPDAMHPMVSSTGCCCVYGTQPQADGTCM